MSHAPLPPDLGPDLERVAQIVAERTTARQIVAGIAGRHLGDEGRLRAAVTLLAARMGGGDRERAHHAAAAVMLIYAAAQVHDELIDEGDRRRGAVADQPRWGGSAALMVGDYLFALAAAEMACAPHPRIIELYSRSVMAICEGRLAPVTRAAPLDLARSQYLQRAELVTATLMASAAGAGAVCGELGQAAEDALTRYGMRLGMALHLAADARDYAGPGLALRGGAITLPLIYAADAGGTSLAERLDGPLNDADLREIQAEVHRLGGVARARDDARSAARSAAEQLAALPGSPARDALQAIAASVP